MLTEHPLCFCFQHITIILWTIKLVRTMQHSRAVALPLPGQVGALRGLTNDYVNFLRDNALSGTTQALPPPVKAEQFTAL